jgi:hypothetical protein
MNGFDERQLLCLRFNEPGRHKEPSMSGLYCKTSFSPHRTARPRHGPARRGERARARVVHRPSLTGFTSGVHEVHLLSRLRSSSNPGTKLTIDFLALIVGFKFF